MLLTNYGPLIPEVRENEGLSDNPSLCQAITDCSKFLRTGTYSAYSYNHCLEFTTVLKRPLELSKYMMKEFGTQLAVHNVLTIDTEGDDRTAPPVLIVQCLGSGSVIIMLDKIKKQLTENNDEPEQIRWLRETLRPLVRAVFSGKVIVIGSDINKDIGQLTTHFGVRSDYENGNPVTVDTKWLFNAAKKSELYHKDLIKFLTKRRAREGLGPVALCANSFNHKPFNVETMTDYLGLDKRSAADKEIGREAWAKLHHTLKIVKGGPPIYLWTKDTLTNRQIFYCHLDAITPLRLLLQYAQKVAHIDKLKLGQDTLTTLLNKALLFAARSLPFAVGFKGLTGEPDEEISDEDSLMIEAEPHLDGPRPCDEPCAAGPCTLCEPERVDESSQENEDVSDSLDLHTDQDLVNSFKEKSSETPSTPAATSSAKMSKVNDRLLLLASNKLPERRDPDGQEDEASESEEPKIKSKVVVVPNQEESKEKRKRKRSRDRDCSKTRDGNRRSKEKDNKRRSRSKDRHSSRSHKGHAASGSRERSRSRRDSGRQKSVTPTQRHTEKTQEHEIERLKLKAQQKCDELSKAMAQNRQVVERSAPPVGGQSSASKGSAPPLGGQGQTSSSDVTSKGQVDDGYANDTKGRVQELISKGANQALAAGDWLNDSKPKDGLISMLKDAESFLAKARELLTTSVFDRLGPVEPETPPSNKHDEIEGASKVLTEAELEDTIICQKSVKWAKSPEVFNKLFGRTNPHREPVRARFLDALFKYDDLENRKDPRDNPTYKLNPNMCNHRSMFPTLTLRSCLHCGLRHNKAMDCAIVRFQEGKELLQSDVAVLSHYPCGYCNSSRHTTRLCPIMHGLCKDCKVRGHLPINKKGGMIKGIGKGKCHITPEDLDFYKEKFSEMAPLGIRTSKADSLWSYTVPTDHVCDPQDFSDSEEEV